MFTRMIAAVLLVSAIAHPSITRAQDADGPIITTSAQAERADEVRAREALAYSYPLPPGAPEADYPLVAWCAAMISGHVALGETLNSEDPLDLDLISLGRLEAIEFRNALTISQSRQTPDTLATARRVTEAVNAEWAPRLALTDRFARTQEFGFFYGLPGRCEHAARRIRLNITTAPATLAEVGLEAPSL